MTANTSLSWSRFTQTIPRVRNGIHRRLHWNKEGCRVWPSRYGQGLHVAYREAEFDGANVNAENDQTYECILKEVDESEVVLRTAICLLQLLPSLSDFEGNASYGSGNRGSYLDIAGAVSIRLSHPTNSLT